MQRMGVVFFGPSGCGKSTIWRVLKLTLAQMGQKIPTYVMNPKSMPREQLLGHMDMYTHEWFDGVLTASARKVVREPPDVKSWIICDGDIDPEWVESLNLVLDDNRLLMMPSGERIQFSPNVNFIFETHDLKFASPATVSWMGMIFLDQETSDVKCIVSAWLKKQPAELQMKLDNWLSEYFFKVLDWVLAQDSAVVDTTKAGIVVSALSHLHGVASKAEFVCAAIRGFGSNLMHTKRAELAKLLYSWTGEMPADHRRPLDGFFNVKRGVHELYTQDTSQQLTFDDFDTEGGAMHWYDEDCPEAVKIPDFDDRIEMYFDKLLLGRALREDRALTGVQEYVMDALGKRYADSRLLDIRALTEEVNKFTPAIFILSTGADPTNAINELARKMKKKVGSIWMGQGQEPAARKLLQQGMLMGSW
ncbi:cytoplasmic dynein 2 heavy chain 1, partial [Chrysochromulina tobinii]